MTFELLIFSVVAFVVIVVLAAFVFVVGIPFDLNFGAAVMIATYIFAVIMPGAMNLWIAATGSGGEDSVERTAAGVRGVAMIGGWTSLILLFVPRNSFTPILPWMIGACFVMFVWSNWRENSHQTKQLEDKGLLKHD